MMATLMKFVLWGHQGIEGVEFQELVFKKLSIDLKFTDGISFAILDFITFKSCQPVGYVGCE